MSKLFVVNEEYDIKVPFLRGMLVKSLQSAGLEFIDAYALAGDIRDEFEDQEIVTTQEMRERIEEILKEEHPDAILSRYKKEDIYREISK